MNRMSGAFAFQETGDILFTLGKNPDAFLNTVTQSAFNRRHARYSHVLLVVAPGLYFHAMPGTGVSWVDAETPEVCFPNVSARWMARRPNLTSAEQLDLKSTAAYFAFQRYNMLLVASQLADEKYRDGHSFCSELIAKIFRSIGHDIVIGKPAELILPDDLDLAIQLQPEQWRDVTDSYGDGFASLEKQSTITAVDRYERESFKQFAAAKVKIAKGAIEFGRLFHEITELTRRIEHGEIDLADFDLSYFKSHPYTDTISLIRALEMPPPEAPAAIHWLQSQHPSMIFPSRESIVSKIQRAIDTAKTSRSVRWEFLESIMQLLATICDSGRALDAQALTALVTARGLLENELSVPIPALRSDAAEIQAAVAEVAEGSESFRFFEELAEIVESHITACELFARVEPLVASVVGSWQRV